MQNRHQRLVFVFNVRFSSLLAIYTGTLGCTVKLPEVCVSHTKRVRDNKTVFTTHEVRRDADVLLTAGLTF